MANNAAKLAAPKISTKNKAAYNSIKNAMQHSIRAAIKNRYVG